MKYAACLLALLLSLSACDDSDPEPTADATPDASDVVNGADADADADAGGQDAFDATDAAPELPQDVAGDPVDPSDTEADGWWTSVDEWELVLVDPQLDVAGMEQANATTPGTFTGDVSKLESGSRRLVRVTLRNLGPEDHSWYPGVQAASDHADVTIEPADFWFYAIFANTDLEASFSVVVGSDVAAGTDVTFTFNVSALNCDDPDPGPIPCPPPNAQTLTLTVAP